MYRKVLLISLNSFSLKRESRKKALVGKFNQLNMLYPATIYLITPPFSSAHHNTQKFHIRINTKTAF